MISPLLQSSTSRIPHTSNVPLEPYEIFTKLSALEWHSTVSFSRGSEAQVLAVTMKAFRPIMSTPHAERTSNKWREGL